MQGGAGIKLYLTPSEPDTIAELSDAVGMTTKRVVSKSKNIKDGLFSNNISERTEEHPLLTRDQARRLPDDEVIIVVDADMPIRAKRLMYYDDTAYQNSTKAKTSTAPLPTPPHTITEADYKYIETTDDLAGQKADAEKAKADAQIRAAEKRDAEAAEAGQGQLASDKDAPAIVDADGQQAPDLSDGQATEAEQPIPQPAPLAEATDLQKKAAPAIEDAGGQQTFDLPDGKAAEAEQPAPLAKPTDLQKKAARLRRRGKERQNALPLPEVSGSPVQVSIEDAAAAHLRIDSMALRIAEAKARAV